MLQPILLASVLLFAACGLEPANLVLIYEVDRDREPAAEKVPIETLLEAARRRVRKLEVLVVLDQLNITSEHFLDARPGKDRVGKPCISVTFNEAGARGFGKLTGGNTPDPTDPDNRRKLAIIIDGEILTAPTIMTRIDDRAEITGRFSQAEVEDLAAVLSAGPWPAPLRFVSQHGADE